MKTAEKISERLKFKNDFEKIDFLTDTIQLDILHQLMESSSCRKTDIAKKMKVSNSFVTQLFSGDKRLSLIHLASLIYHFNLDFKFKLIPKGKSNVKIVRFSDYPIIKSKSDYCLIGDNKKKYQVNKPIEEESGKICSV